MSFRYIKVGDKVRRVLAGVIPMDLLVVDITDSKIVCAGGWEFSRDTGIEIDEDISIPVSHLIAHID